MQFQIIIRQILNCAVPLFLALSGYFMINKANNIKKKILSLYIPCVIWSSAFFLLSIYKNENIFISILFLFLCGYSVYYFIALIIQYYTLLPLFKHISKNTLNGAAVISIASMIVVTYLTCIKGYNIPLILYAGLFPLWIIFFAIGCYLGKAKGSVNYRLKWWYILFVVGLVGSYFESKWLVSISGEGYGGIKFSSFIFSFAVIMICLSSTTIKFYKTHSGKLSALIAKIGGISFGIYLIHCFLIMIISFISKNVTAIIFIGESWLFKFILTSFCTVAIIIIAKKNVSAEVY